MKTTLQIIIFALLTSLQIACDSCPDEPEHQTYYLSDEEKAFLPYKDMDTLKFINNTDSTDTITFTGTLKNYFEQHSLGEECIIRDDTAEVLNIDFLGDNGYEINIKIYFEVDNGSAWTRLINTINEVEYVTSYPNTLLALDSINFNNKNYHNVYSIATTSCNNGYDYMIYCNKTYGILFFELKNCTAWLRVI